MTPRIAHALRDRDRPLQPADAGACLPESAAEAPNLGHAVAGSAREAFGRALRESGPEGFHRRLCERAEALLQLVALSLEASGRALREPGTVAEPCDGTLTGIVLAVAELQGAACAVGARLRVAVPRFEAIDAPVALLAHRPTAVALAERIARHARALAQDAAANAHQTFDRGQGLAALARSIRECARAGLTAGLPLLRPPCEAMDEAGGEIEAIVAVLGGGA